MIIHVHVTSSCILMYNVHVFIFIYSLVVLPSDPLTTDGPTLQHLGNKRPRPPRRNQNRPAGLKKAAETGPSSIWDLPASDDTDSNSTPVETKK